jgi:hypothetical protein
MLQFNKLAHFAGVAELADAQDLGSCGRKAVGVQIPPPAHLTSRNPANHAKTQCFWRGFEYFGRSRPK